MSIKCKISTLQEANPFVSYHHDQVMTSWYHWTMDIIIVYGNGYKNVMESLCNGWLCGDGYVVVVIAMVLLVMSPVVMNIQEHIADDQGVKDKDVEEKGQVKMEKQVKLKEHIKPKELLEQKEHKKKSEHVKQQKDMKQRLVKREFKRTYVKLPTSKETHTKRPTSEGKVGKKQEGKKAYDQRQASEENVVKEKKIKYRNMKQKMNVWLCF